MASSAVHLFWNAGVLEHMPPGWSPAQGGPLADQLDPILSPLLPADVAWIHPEHPERLRHVVERLRAEPIPGAEWRTAQAASVEDILRVHSGGHVEAMLALRGRYELLDVDTTAVSPGSIDAALLAAGAVRDAAETVLRGEARSAFALVRPPGHHAESGRPRGFCLFNNVAVAAAWAMAREPGLRVLIIDWDAHHGNGTQEVFAGNPDVLFFDTHRAAPFYPGSGDSSEQGRGNIINLPLPAGAADKALLYAFDHLLEPAAARFRPDLVLVSAGFDADRRDLALGLSPGGFAALAHRVRAIAQEYAGGRLAFVTEGGYNVEALAENVHTTITALCDGPVPAIVDNDDTGLAEMQELVAYHSPRWR